MKRAILFLAIIISLSSFAQTENTSGDTLKTHKSRVENYPVMQNYMLSEAASFRPSVFYNAGFSHYMPPLPPLNFQSFTDNFTYAPNPQDNLNNQFFIDSRNWISTAKTSTNFIGLGGISMAGASYNTKVGDFMVLTGGLYASKYNIFNGFYNNFGVNGNVKFILNDRISMNVYGQYSGEQPVTLYPLIQNMYPQNYYGGSIEFKVNDNWGLITGANREFDIIKRKWVTQPFIMPVFYKLGR